MAFKIGNKIAITDNSVFNVTDTSDSDGGVVNSRGGNINLDLSTGSIFKIPRVDTPRLKEKLSISNFPAVGENKKITLISEGRGTPINSTAIGSFSYNSGASLQGPIANFAAEEYINGFRFSTNGDYFYYVILSGGRMYVRRDTLGTNWRAPSADNTYDQNVRYDTNFKSIPLNDVVLTPFFNKTGTRIWFPYEGETIHEFTLSSAWDLTSTITEIDTYDLTSYTTDTSPTVAFQGWLADGHVLFGFDRSGSPNDTLIALYCNTAYDLSTVYESKTVDPASVGNTSEYAAMNYNGDKVYTADANIIYEHTLSTPFDIDTLSASSTSLTYTQNPGYATDPGDIRAIQLLDSDKELQFTVFGTGSGETAHEVFDTNRTTATRRSYFIWDSDKISMLNDSAPPMTDSGETDLFEFLVFDSAIGAKQTSFINNV